MTEESGTTDKVIPSFTHHYCIILASWQYISRRALSIIVLYVPKIGKVSALPAPLIPLFLGVLDSDDAVLSG